MTENTRIEKKPLWEPIIEKEIAEVQRNYLEKIGVEKSRMEDYKQRQTPEMDKRTPTMNAHLATLYLIKWQRVDALETFLSFAEGFIEMYQKIGLALDALEKQVLEISEKTHTDISNFTAELQKVREKVDAPIYSYLKEQKNADEDIRKKGEYNIDHLTRSH